MFKFLLALSLLSSAPPVFAEDASPSAVVLEAVDGGAPIEIQRGGVWNPAAIGLTIQPGESVRTTTSSARLVYGDGSIVALSTDTEVRIQPEADRVIELERGTVWGKIEKSPPPPITTGAPNRGGTPDAKSAPYKFTLRSRSVVMGVRGTEFLVESAADGGVVVNTLEGTVDSAPDLPTLRSGRGVPVHRLERIRAHAGTPLGKAEAFKGEELIAHLTLVHGGLVRFLSRPVRRLRPKHAVKRAAREEKREERLRRKATIQANPNGAFPSGQGTYGSPARR